MTPFIFATLLPFALLPLAALFDEHIPGGTDEVMIAVAAALWIPTVTAAFWAWRRRVGGSLPRVVPPFVFLLVVALLRDAQGGAPAGYAVLVLLPALWFALYGRLAELIAVLVAIVLTLAVPILVEGYPRYPESEWRRLILTVVMAGLVSYAVQGLLRRVEERTAAVERSQTLLSATLESAGEGIFLVGADGVTQLVNPAGARLLGYTPEELIGGSAHDLVHHSHADGTPYPRDECPVHQTLTSGVGRLVSDEVYWRKDGTPLPVEYRTTPVRRGREIEGVVVMVRDVTERRAVEQMKDQFVSVVSHELRTPLTSIRGSLGLLAGGMMGEIPGEGKEMLDIAVANTDRLVRLINDILDIERIESGKVQLERELRPLAPLVRDAVAGLAGTAEEAGVRVECEFGDGAEELTAWVDPDRAVQVVTNLLSNAIKFSDRDGIVTVGLAPAGSDVEISVRDRGRGIPADKLEAVFGRFQQVDATDARVRGGSGLGLAISQSLVEQHGGRIWVESDVGVGSVFHVRLPRVVDEDRGDSRCVLVCDDDQLVRDRLEAVLGAHGYDVVTVASGEEAVAEAAARRPDAIVLDLLMPGGMDGWQTMAALRANPETESIPVVILSVVVTSGVEQPPAGARSTLGKPVDDSVLLASVADAIDTLSLGRVLIIEDDGDLARVLATGLRARGIDAEIAQSAQQAVQLAHRLRPDLVLLDLALPDADGSAVVGALRASGRLGTIPLVVYTARDVDAHERRELQLGETLFLTKSKTEPEELHEKVAMLLADVMQRRES